MTSGHTFAVLQLSAGTHFLQVSKWLGHSTFTLTLDTYGDYIPEQDGRRAQHPARATRPREAGWSCEQHRELVWGAGELGQSRY